MGFPWKRKAAANEWVRVSQCKFPLAVNTGYVLEPDFCGSYPIYIH